MNYVTAGGLVAALLLFTILTYKIWRFGWKVRSSLNFQLSIVIVLWLASELTVFIFPTVASPYAASDGIGLFDILHLLGMASFAGFMAWRVLRFTR